MVASRMDRTNRWLLGGAAGLFALALMVLAGVRPLAAQDYEKGQASIDPRAGVAFPFGDLAETHKVGFDGGLGLAYKVHPHIAVRGDFDFISLNGRNPQFGVVLAPTLTVVHYHAGLEFDFGPPEYQDFPLTFRWNLGAGGTSMSAQQDFPDGVDVDFSGTYPSVNSGIKIGYRITPELDLFVGGQIFWTFTNNEGEIAELVKRAGIEPYGNAWTAPVTFGVKYSFQ